jgi:muramoyltetrapeptide carboxypeptidase
VLTRPRALPTSAHIAVLAISGPSDPERIRLAGEHIEARGHRVTIAPNVGARHHEYLAGSDDERAEILNRALRSGDYDAIFFARGGYGAMRILDRIDYAAIRARPIPIVGFSDLTALHQAMATHAGVVGFHGPMLNLDFHDRLTEDRERWLWDLLAGKAPMERSFAGDDVLASGEAEGPLFGGCLSLTAALMGTPYDFWIPGGIWFWEDTGEPRYRIDRMLTHLRLAGRFDELAGIAIGELRDCGEEAALTELLVETFVPLGIPVVRNLPFGHRGNNLALPIGVRARLSTRDEALTLLDPAVER